MGRIAIVTDSNSGITQEQGKELGVSVIPMPFYIDDKLYFEGINLTQEEFYHKLEHDAKISTSMPAPGDVIDLWKRLLPVSGFHNTVQPSACSFLSMHQNQHFPA